MKKITRVFLLTLSTFVLVGCGTTSTTQSSDTSTATTTTVAITDTDFEATDWTEATHSNDVNPNYTEVFSDTEVKRLDFVVTTQRWQSMLDDMTTNYGTFGGTATSVPIGIPTAPTTTTTTVIDSDEDPSYLRRFTK